MVDPHESGRLAWEQLRRLVLERLARRPGGHLVEMQLREVDLRLRLTLDGDGGKQAFLEALVAGIDEAIDDAVRHAAAFQPGRAHCHRCGRASCEHSQPPSSRHVFAAYSPTGQPRWEDFAQLCLERRHPRVDELYEDPPALVTVVQDREALHGAMVEAFHSPEHDLLGQVVAGFFPLRARAEEGRGILALSVQVAASRTRSGRLRLGLNLLGRAPSGEGLERLWERQDELPWRKPVRWAQAALETLRPLADPPEQRILGILTGLARRFEREQRARSRRTRHAEQRHATGERPTRKALDDARAARSDALLVDERRGTLVVLGERGRTHFFTAEGQLVSSVRYSPEAIERKRKGELWRAATAAEVETFLQRIG
jgi:hypothetical protein